MEDRIALYPGRVRMTPVAGQPDLFDMTMADQPTVEGTALNKGNLLSDPTAALADAEYGETPDTPNEALALIAKGKVGVIVRSVATDLGENYALCNGDMYDESECPALSAMLPRNRYPKTSPTWYQDTGARADGYLNINELYNGEFISAIGSYSQCQVINKDGSPKGFITRTDMTSDTNARLWYIEHNGTYYLGFLYLGSGNNTAMAVYRSSNLSTWTFVKNITGLKTSNYKPEGDNDMLAKFDGTYYYINREGYENSTSGRNIAVVNSSFNLVSEVFVPSQYFTLRMCGDRCYAIMHNNNSSNYQIGVKQLNGTTPPTALSGYRTCTWTSWSTNVRVVEFSDTYDVMWQSGCTTLAFIPRNGTSAIKTYTLPFAPAFVYPDETGTMLIVADNSKYITCSTSAADPTQASAWSGEVAISFADGWYTYYTVHSRHKASIIPDKQRIVRAPLLPTIAESECYNFIKVK